jgi:hypothetical protein
MLSQAKEKFPHRRNSDGTLDSICAACLLKLAMAQSEEQLHSLESSHVCDPIRLCKVREHRARIQSQST